MAQEETIKLFEGKQVRYVWDDEQQKYFFSIVDVIQVLTDSNIPKRYWSDLKRKLAAEGSEVNENIVQLKMQASDGKRYLTDVADTEQLLRLIQSVPSKKAEPLRVRPSSSAERRFIPFKDSLSSKLKWKMENGKWKACGGAPSFFVGQKWSKMVQKRIFICKSLFIPIFCCNFAAAMN